MVIFLKERKAEERKHKMAVLTAECDIMFNVDKEQIELFKRTEKNQRSREKADITVSKISRKIIMESKLLPDDNT